MKKIERNIRKAKSSIKNKLEFPDSSQGFAFTLADDFGVVSIDDPVGTPLYSIYLDKVINS